VQSDRGTVEVIPRVDALPRDRVVEMCPRLEEVQDRTNQAKELAGAASSYVNPAAYGSAIHFNLAQQIKDLWDERFRAERSFLKLSEEVPPGETAVTRYGQSQSIRIDVIELVEDHTFCVYNIKTGKSGLSAARIAEIARTVARAYPNARRLSSSR
jgi:hypothetical protein